ncbi:MAG: EamA family transporter [Betaproteobacteria bacterium]|nr:EamA family transporter [Betaproteobacteria bacterium]MBL0290774.1 EamA family transporter [Betaproteobacteria bacterium]
MQTQSEGPRLFVALCIFWGGNWLATKGLVMNAPPFASAASRALLCGAVMLALAGRTEVRALFAHAPLRIVAIGLLTSTICNGAIYWGVARLSTGLAAIVNNALTPIGLLLFGYLLGEETLSRRRLAGIALGVVGLALLFARRTQGSIDTEAIAGLAAVAVGTLSYCLGSVWCRPLLRHSGPMAVGGMQMLIGGAFLVALSGAFERPDPGQLAGMGSPVFLLSLAWTGLVGGAAALVIYLRLIRDWGPTRAGMYAFVTPIVATALGAAVLGERLGPLEIAGAVVLLAAAALVLSGGFVRRPVDATPPA